MTGGIRITSWSHRLRNGAVQDHKNRVVNVVGGTGMAIRIAFAYNSTTTVFNLTHRPHGELVEGWMACA